MQAANEWQRYSLDAWYAAQTMPITPFHLGPGLFVHSTSPQKISFLSFVAANIVIDLEPAYYIFTQQYPLHRIVHSYVGATWAIALTIGLVLLVLRFARRMRMPDVLHWRQLTPRQVVWGAMWGGYSHIVLDSIMHADMHPCAPFNQSNPLFGLFSNTVLHILCIVLGLIGLVVLVMRKGHQSVEEIKN